MRILFLGGTRFLGRHAVDVALARGHAVTLFTRGRTPNHWGSAVALLTGDDRDRFRQLMIERVLTQFEAGFDPDNLDYFIAKLGGAHAPAAIAS